MLDDARLLAWGCVSYLPLTPFVARVALALFGPSLAGLRFFAALGQSIVLVLVGLIARALGGSRRARVDQFLANRVLAGRITNAYGVPNEDSLDRRLISLSAAGRARPGPTSGETFRSSAE